MIDKYIVNGNGQVPKMQPVSHVVAPLEASSDIGKGSEPSVLKVIIGILIEPGETFRSVAGRASWTALVPLVLFLVLATVEAITLVHRVDMNASARQQILRSSHASKLSPEQIDKMVEIGVKMGRFQAYIAPVTYTLLVDRAKDHRDCAVYPGPVYWESDLLRSHKRSYNKPWRYLQF
jgi:hypothetical protein